jgi:hypothetical protein
MWWIVIAIVLVILAFVLAVITLAGIYRWQSDTRVLDKRMEAVRMKTTSTSYDPRELVGLPAPVQRYFRSVLKEGQPLIAAVSIEHTGTFNMAEATELWKPFSSTQRVIIMRPAFIWDARIHIAPGISVHVHDAYIASEGILVAKLFGLFTVMKEPSTPELALGELMRFFAEAVWYPTALLPSQGVIWEAIDGTRAGATLADGDVTVKLVFQFDTNGLISSVRSDGRYRSVEGVRVSSPWHARVWGYEMQGGMLVPLYGEVGWLFADEPKPYWRGRIQRIQYELSNK